MLFFSNKHKHVCCFIIAFLMGSAYWEQQTMLDNLTPRAPNIYENQGKLDWSSSSKDKTDFDKAVSLAFHKIQDEQDAILRHQQQRNKFDLHSWTQKTLGGLDDEDRVLLAKIYGKASSVFEYGLGESTYIANHVGVSRYAGIDSDVAWVDQTRRKVAPHFRFYYGDVGNVGAWGYPKDPTQAKIVYQYQVAPLESELDPFDVYMIDGRFRVPLVLLSFLHASARGANPEDTIVLLHDCYQPGFSPDTSPQHLKVRNYTINDDILDLVDHSRDKLCVYKRKTTTTDAMLLERYQHDCHLIG